MSEYTIFPSRKTGRTYTPRMAGTQGLEDLLVYQIDSRPTNTGLFSLPLASKTAKGGNSYSWNRGSIFDIAKEIGYPNLYPGIPSPRPFGPPHQNWEKPDGIPDSHVIDLAPVNQERLPYCLPAVILTDLSNQIGAKINIRDTIYCNTPSFPFQPGWAPSQLDISDEYYRAVWQKTADEEARRHARKACREEFGTDDALCVAEKIAELRKAFGFPDYNKEPETYNSFTSDFSIRLVHEARSEMWNRFLGTRSDSLVRVRVVLSCTPLDCPETLGDGVSEEDCASQCTKDIYLKFVTDQISRDIYYAYGRGRTAGQIRLEFLLDELNNGRPVPSLVNYDVILGLLRKYSGDPNNIELYPSVEQPISTIIGNNHIVLIVGYEFLPDGRFKIIIQDSNEHYGQHRYSVILPTSRPINQMIGIGYDHGISTSRESSKIEITEPSIPIDASAACLECGKSIEPCASTPTPSLPTVTQTPTDGSTPTPSIP